jgi:hypothetical protein
MKRIRTLLLSGLMLGFIPLGSACYAEEEVPPPEYVDTSYQPQYYDGYVVYYDGVGRPYYYVNGAAVWVPPSSPLYIGFVNHWHRYGPAYGHWYAHYGYRYHGYRRHYRR